MVIGQKLVVCNAELYFLTTFFPFILVPVSYFLLLGPCFTPYSLAKLK